MTDNKIEVYYDIISPYAYLGLELFRKSSLYDSFEVELIPVPLGTLLSSTGNPGPNGIASKRKVALLDACMQCKKHGIEILGPPKHPFINLDALRFIHCIEDLKERYETALVINRACWAENTEVDTSEKIAALLQSKGLLKDEWKDLDNFTKENKGRKKLKTALKNALEIDIFGVPTFRYKNTNFWGSDRIELLEEFTKRPEFFLDNNYEKMINTPSAL